MKPFDLERAKAGDPVETVMLFIPSCIVVDSICVAKTQAILEERESKR